MLKQTPLRWFLLGMVVITLATNNRANTILTGQRGTPTKGLGEQAYSLATTRDSAIAYWAIGVDSNGAMYGGLQLAELIQMHGLKGDFNQLEKPAILKRGIKLNLPFDRNSTTYGSRTATSKMEPIDNVWDMARTEDLPDWHVYDASVLKEYSDLGGEGIPSCH